MLVIVRLDVTEPNSVGVKVIGIPPCEAGATNKVSISGSNSDALEIILVIFKSTLPVLFISRDTGTLSPSKTVPKLTESLMIAMRAKDSIVVP